MDRSSKYDLPLHEVTQRYGEDGLEERLCYEIDSLDLSPEDQARINKALDLALYAHLPQTRGEHPYSTHILRTSARIIYHFKVKDPEIIIAALLHDIVEDQSKRILGEIDLKDEIEYKSAALSMIEEQFGGEVAGLVAKVTNHNFDEVSDKNQRYKEDVTQAMTENPKARVIKLSDFLDNCSGIIYNESPPLAEKLAAKYLPLIPIMKEFALMSDTPLNSEARSYIVERLERAESRCYDILEIQR